MMKVLALCGLLAVANAQENIVKTSLGVIEGVVNSDSRSFRGVKFAEAPVGSLRWQSPVDKKPWTGTIQAFNDAPGCYQHCVLPPLTCPPTMSEDCLAMNIFTPRVASMKGPAPVMVFIHGGNFKQGYAGGLLYDGANLAANTGVVVAVIQYRLGSIGFLNTESNDGNFAGNYGIQDQRTALRFIRNNIAAFGGDPQSVTVFGQSAGAMSIATHISSPESKGLFDRAILESEPFGIPFRSAKTWKPFAGAFAKYANCSSGIDSCLLGLDATDIISAQVDAEKDILAEYERLLELFVPWTPTIGTNELPLSPWEAWVSGSTTDVPMIIGTVTNEGWEFVYSAFGKSLSGLEYSGLLDVLFGLKHHHDVISQYPSVSGDNRAVASKLATDSLFVCSTRNATLSGPVAHNSPVYLYHFDHIMSFGPKVWGPMYSFCNDKVCHAEELIFVFGNQNSTDGVVFTDDEKTLSDSMQFYWSNFAATGNPNTPPPSSPLAQSITSQLNWPLFESADEQTVRFHTPTDLPDPAPYRETCKLWDSFGYDFA